MSIRRALPIALSAAVLVGCVALTAPLSADTAVMDAETQRRWVVEHFAGRPWEPLRKYSADVRGCLSLSSDLTRLLAELELGRLERPGGKSGEQADPWLTHFAREIRRLNGPLTGAPGVCLDAGGPATLNATVTLGQAMLRYVPPQGWSQELKAAARAMLVDTHWHPYKPLLTNLAMGQAVGPLVVGEALCDETLWKEGVGRTNSLFKGVLERGGYEVNALHYSHLHMGVLMAMLDLRDPAMREQGRLLLEYELLIGAHLYLPGAGLLPPYSRARRGALRIAEERERALGPVMAYFARDPEVDLRRFDAVHAGLLHAAVTDYELPASIRSIFLERAGYRFGARQFRNGSPARAPHLVYPRLSQDGRGATFPWQAHALPGGRAGVGMSHGAHSPGVDPVSSGVHVRCDRCDGGWIALYQGQRFTRADRDFSGARVLDRPVKGPRDSHDEGTDFAGQLFGDTMLRVWDPEPGRSLPWTRAFLPNWDHPRIGGTKGGWPTAGGWYVGELDGVRVGFRPLVGDAGDTPSTRCPPQSDWDFNSRTSGPSLANLYHVLCLRGTSGGVTVVESGPTRSLAAFAADLDTRHARIRARGVGRRAVAESDAIADDGRRCRMRIEYRPGPGPLERRYVDCSAPYGPPWRNQLVPDDAPPTEGGLDFGMMWSPWVTWEKASRILRLRREGYEDHVMNWGSALLEPNEPRPAVCGGRAQPVSPPAP